MTTKSQIGGVREILILGIQERIIIQELEKLSYAINEGDHVEMLTEGKNKLKSIQSAI